MEYYRFIDLGNDEIGLVIREPGKRLTYIRWESPDPSEYKFGDLDTIDSFTPSNVVDKDIWNDMNDEILDRETDYGSFDKVDLAGFFEFLFKSGR